MSVETEAPPAADTANPALLGVPCAAIGTLALALFLLGYPAGFPNLVTLGAMMPLFLALGIGLFIAAIWATQLGVGPLVSIFGLFGAFFWSIAFVIAGFVNNWFGTNPSTATDDEAGAALTATFSVFLLCWAVGTTVLVLATLRLPLAITVVLVFSDLVFIFAWLAFITGTFVSGGLWRTLAGITCLVIPLAAVYVFYGSMTSALGGRAMSTGASVVK